MSRPHEVIAYPQGEDADVFPEIVVAVEDDRVTAARRAWEMQSKSRGLRCLYGIRVKEERS